MAGSAAAITFIIVLLLLPSPNKVGKSTGTDTTAGKADTNENKADLPPPSPEKQVFTFTANGAKKSATFTLAGEKTRIAFNCDSGGMLCSAMLKKTGSGFDIDLIVNVTESAADENIFYRKKGEYYIENISGKTTFTVFDTQ